MSLINDQAMMYWRLLQQGVAPADAFQQAFPDGIPSEEDQMREAAKKQQDAGIAQAGGVLAGALGARELARAVAGEKSILSGIGDLFGGGGGSEVFADSVAGDSVPYYFGPDIGGSLGSSGVGGGFGGGEAAAAAEGAGSSLLGTVAPLAAIAYGTNAAYDFARGKKLNMLQKGAMALPTAGLSLVSDRLQSALGLDHKSTKEMQAERWGSLIDAGVPNAEIAYAANHPDGDTGKWSSGKYAGQDWTFEKASDLAREDPTHFQHVLGNYQALGNDYSGLTDAQQKSFTAKALADGLYSANKGDVLISDQGRAKSILAEILGQQPTAAAPAAGAPGVSQNLIYKMNPQEMAIQKQFGSQLAAALAGR